MFSSSSSIPAVVPRPPVSLVKPVKEDETDVEKVRRACISLLLLREDFTSGRLLELLPNLSVLIQDMLTMLKEQPVARRQTGRPSNVCGCGTPFNRSQSQLTCRKCEPQEEEEEEEEEEVKINKRKRRPDPEPEEEEEEEEDDDDVWSHKRHRKASGKQDLDEEEEEEEALPPDTSTTTFFDAHGRPTSRQDPDSIAYAVAHAGSANPIVVYPGARMCIRYYDEPLKSEVIGMARVQSLHADRMTVDWDPSDRDDQHTFSEVGSIDYYACVYNLLHVPDRKKMNVIMPTYSFSISRYCLNRENTHRARDMLAQTLIFHTIALEDITETIVWKMLMRRRLASVTCFNERARTDLLGSIMTADTEMIPCEKEKMQCAACQLGRVVSLKLMPQDIYIGGRCGEAVKTALVVCQRAHAFRSETFSPESVASFQNDVGI
jgi:hypothetical protein